MGAENAELRGDPLLRGALILGAERIGGALRPVLGRESDGLRIGAERMLGRLIALGLEARPALGLRPPRVPPLLR